MAEKKMRCSFCDKSEDQVKAIFVGKNAYVCAECVEILHEIIVCSAQDKTDPFNCLKSEILDEISRSIE